MLKQKVLVGDFETTVYEGQEMTAVWAAACVELYTENVKIFHSINDIFEYLLSIKQNVIIYFHNLKFDGSFWLPFLMQTLKLKQAYTMTGEDFRTIKWMDEKDMPSKSFKYSISDMGQWYSITIKYGKHAIRIRDSLKLLPFSVKKIGKSFGTKHKKLDMEYKGFRYPGCDITDEEKEYIANDVFVVKEALEIMFNEGHNKLTIGSCCLSEYKKIMGKEDFSHFFPDMYSFKLDTAIYKYDNADAWVRKSYKGGWCYLVRGKEGRIFHNGTTADVNSLYPSMMSSESGNIYPVGEPTFWSGNYIPRNCHDPNIYYFVRIRTRFYLKKGYLPFIQIKGNPLYKGTESLETSDVYDPYTDAYYSKYRDYDGNLVDAKVELTLTMTDYKLMQEHYTLVDMEILDGCYFYAMTGIFDRYMEKYKRIKLESKGAIRELAKLFLNNLYGKMASSTESNFKVAFEKPDGTIGFVEVESNDKRPGYIPVGSAITSYARNFTIRAAQKNYYGKDKPGFIYADTDSIHCDLPPEQIKGITVHDRDFCCWKLEACWDEAIFTRQKTYIEHVTHENVEPCEPFYNVKCAGMPDRCKDLFLRSMEGWNEEKDLDENGLRIERTQEVKDFLSVKRTLEDFTIGLRVPGKLLPKRIKGGIVLTDSWYQMR